MVRLTEDPPPPPPTPGLVLTPAEQERNRAYAIVMQEYRRLQSQPLYNATLAERQRQLRLLDRLAKLIKG